MFWNNLPLGVEKLAQVLEDAMPAAAGTSLHIPGRSHLQYPQLIILPFCSPRR